MDVSAIATVQTVVGNVVAVNSDGTIRVLKTGDALFQGELLKTDLGASATLTHTHGLTQTIGENTSLTLTQSVDGVSHFADDKSLLPAEADGGTLVISSANGEGDSSNALFNFYEAGVKNTGSTTDNVFIDGHQHGLETLSYSAFSALLSADNSISLALNSLATSGSTSSNSVGNDAMWNVNAMDSNGGDQLHIASQSVGIADLTGAPDSASDSAISQLLNPLHSVF